MWLVPADAISGNLPFRLEEGPYVLGRTSSADIVVRDLTLSRRHAQLSRTNCGWVLQDLGSRNGTFVNSCRIAAETPVDLNCEVRFGGVRCRLSATPVYEIDTHKSTVDIVIPREAKATWNLTPAQQEVLDHVLQGLDEHQIAQKLGRSPHTIHTHIKALFVCFNVHSRPELIAKFVP